MGRILGTFLVAMAFCQALHAEGPTGHPIMHGDFWGETYTVVSGVRVNLKVSNVRMARTCDADLFNSATNANIGLRTNLSEETCSEFESAPMHRIEYPADPDSPILVLENTPHYEIGTNFRPSATVMVRTSIDDGTETDAELACFSRQMDELEAALALVPEERAYQLAHQGGLSGYYTAGLDDNMPGNVTDESLLRRGNMRFYDLFGEAGTFPLVGNTDYVPEAAIRSDRSCLVETKAEIVRELRHRVAVRTQQTSSTAEGQDVKQITSGNSDFSSPASVKPEAQRID